ncbi:MAG: tol-pal system protein YbgF [Desulfovibrio sp.]|jgi:tol-pal system protein YbgF|nr:tol-pal system protein YbgF [Desulfovibrio sp.]
MRPFLLLLSFLALGGCAASDGERLAALEERVKRDGQVLDLRLSRAEERIAGIETDLEGLRREMPADKKKGRVPAPGNLSPSPGPAPLPLAGKSSQAGEAGTSAKSGASGRSGQAGGGQSVYDAALALYHKGGYEKAAGAFKDFLQSSPQSSLAPNALYWIGECAYSRGKYDEAILTFKDVALKFPAHPKAADALLKAGYAYERLQDPGNARFYWQLLIDDHPKSPSAALARRRMSGS